MKKKITIALVVLAVIAAACLGYLGWRWYDANVDRSGWTEKNGRICYKDFYGDLVTGWMEIDGSRYYFGADHGMATQWLELDGQKYYLGDNGAAATGWLEVDGHRYYMDEDGSMVSGWLKLDDQSYYFSKEGIMTTGWLKLRNLLFYFHEDGTMATGWLEVDGKTYYLRNNGILATNWLKLDDHYYYLGSDGAMATGWKEINAQRYFFAEDGSRATGWSDIEDNRYYFDENGIMTTGWLQDGEYSYYLLEDGTMAVSPTQIGEQTYYFTPNGIHVVLVNSRHPIPEDYTTNLVTMDNGFQMDERCLDALTQMLADCEAAGCSYSFNSGYRSIDEQSLILEERTLEYMEEDKTYAEARYMALLSVAIPGTSEHHLGLAADIGGTSAMEWLSEHCWEYGFILRYLEGKTEITGIVYEPWHFRYVGTAVSMDMKDTGLCLEEYLGAANQ